MLLILAWVATAVVTLILAVVALLLVLSAVPVGVRAARPSGSERVTVKLLWLFGAVHIPLTGRTRGPHRKERRAAKAKRQKQKINSGKRPRRPAPGEIPVIVRAVTTLVRGVLRRFRISADGDLWVGLDDPADTGLLWGATAPILLRAIRRTGLRVHPSFAGAQLAFTGHAVVLVVPLTVVVPVLHVFLSRDGRTMVRILRGRS